MSDNKNNIFVQLYKPIDPQSTPPTQQPAEPIKTGFSPESDPFSADAGPSEYAPILEYVEPHIDESLSQHVQSANPAFIPQPSVPLTPTQTPPVPGIQPIKLSSVPLTDNEIEKELKTDVYTAIRWLAEWCIRQLQINKKNENEV